jgi:muconate cycloisomerase
MTGHRIDAMRVHVVKVPAKAVHAHGSGDVAGIHAVLLELRTDSGLTGWGEASPWPVFTGTAEAPRRRTRRRSMSICART